MISLGSGNEITSVMLRKTGATMQDNPKYSAARVAKADCEVRSVFNISDIFVIPVDRTAAPYKTKLSYCWIVRRFEVIYSDGHNISLYDHKGVRRNTEIYGLNPL